MLGDTERKSIKVASAPWVFKSSGFKCWGCKNINIESIKKHQTTLKYAVLRKDGLWTRCPLLNESYPFGTLVPHVPLGRFSKNPVKCYVEPKLAAREHFEILHSCCPVPADGWSNKGICIYDHLCTIPTSIELRPKLGNLLLQADVGASWGGSRSIPLQ